MTKARCRCCLLLSSDSFMCANDGGGNECTENLGFAAAEKHAQQGSALS